MISNQHKEDKMKPLNPLFSLMMSLVTGLILTLSGCGSSGSGSDDNATNHPPKANAQSVTTSEDTIVTIALTASDEDNDTLQFIVTSGTLHGTLSGTAPNLTYTPEVNYHGTDSFKFKVNDSTTDSAEATVTITVTPVNDAPVAADDTAMTTQNGATININVLANDTDVDGDTLSIQSVTAPAHGSATINNDTIEYKPPTDFSGTVQFDYTASDGHATDTATITVTVGKGWNTSADILENNSSDADTPHVAMNSYGDAMVIWAQSRGLVDHDILGRFYRHGDGWNTIQLVENDLNNSEQPQVAIDPQGNAVAVWREYDNSQWNIMANTYDAETGQWGTPQLLEHLDTNASDPMVAMSANGDAVAVWWQYDTADWSIFANHYDAASHSWDTNATVLEHGSGDAYDPKVAMDDHGNAIAIWQQHDGSIFGTYVNHYSSATHSWLSTARRLDQQLADTTYQSIALDANGNAVALWTSTYQGVIRLFANQYIAGDTWQGPQIIQDDNRTADQCTVAYDTSGNAMALWTQTDPDRRNLYANRLAAGSVAWDGSIPVRKAGEDIYAPVLRFDAQGNGIAAYMQMNPDWIFDIYAVRYSPARGWWGTTLLEDNKKDARGVDLGVDDDGYAFAVWHQSDGSYERVYYNRLQ